MEKSALQFKKYPLAQSQLDGPALVELAIAILQVKRRRRALERHAQPSHNNFASLNTEARAEPVRLLDRAIAALLHLLDPNSQASLADVEESVVTISELLERAVSQAEVSLRSSSIQHLVTWLLHIMQLPAHTPRSAPDSQHDGGLNHAARFDARSCVGLLSHRSGGVPGSEGSTCARGHAACCALQALSQHHMHVLQVVLEEGSLALLRAHQQLAAAPAAGGGGGADTCATGDAPPPGAESPQTAASPTEGIHVLLDTLQHAIGLLPWWAGALGRPAGSSEGTCPGDLACGAALDSGTVLESVAGRILLAYKMSCSLGPRQVHLADATKAVTMQLLVALQQLAEYASADGLP